jgi:hypothetical protein
MKQITKLLKNLTLLLVGLILLGTIGLIGLVYTLYKGIFGGKSIIKYWANIFFELAILVDKFGNILLGSFLNRYGIAQGVEDYYPFGKAGDTISFAMAINKEKLSDLLRFIEKILNFFEPEHLNKVLDLHIEKCKIIL